MDNPRPTFYGIHEVFTQRWSPRALTGETLPEDTLMSFIEAACWAPSAHNSQPWRFIYAYRNTPEFEMILSTMLKQNSVWAQKASALVVFAGQSNWIPPNMDQEVTLNYRDFDVGAAAMCFSLQATFAGWATHAIAGFDKSALRTQMRVPEEFVPLLIMAVGRRNVDASALPAELRDREKPNTRYAMKDLVMKGYFKS